MEQRRPLLLSVSQVADELSCSRASVFGLIHGGHLEAVRTGRSYRLASIRTSAAKRWCLWRKLASPEADGNAVPVRCLR
ncbi:MAG: excisionase family DNA-binding protein [Nitrososphaerales archaeon]